MLSGKKQRAVQIELLAVFINWFYKYYLDTLPVHKSVPRGQEKYHHMHCDYCKRKAHCHSLKHGISLNDRI